MSILKSSRRFESEPLAIIGMGCRFPGGAVSPERFWDLLCAGGDAIRQVPRQRWDIRKFYDSDPERPGKYNAKEGGFLNEDLQLFDAGFFGVSPREASQMDPQQRLLLETTWEAIEDSGTPAEKLRRGKTGVFVGAFCLDSKLLRLNPLNRELIMASTAAGSTMTMLANKISYLFDFKGPSVTMDTACSSSLLALHFAGRSLLNRDCDVAIVGGVNVMLVPEYPISMSKGRFLSAHGRCKAFDADATGYTRSEGCGILILKPLSRALSDGDRIHALVVETGTNQDGRTIGISMPSPEAQMELFREVYGRAGVPMSEVQYVEAHGTGTQAGDKAEAQALHQMFSQGRAPQNKLVVGAVKTNLGHLEAAAGVAGLIKTILCLKHRQIPPNLHFRNPNPQIPFADLCLHLPTHLEPWPEYGKVAYAGVNSFGYGGANAHVLLQEAPTVEHERTSTNMPTPFLVPVSARSQPGLVESARQLGEWIAARSEVDFHDLAHTLAHRRDHHEYRLSVIAGSCDGLRSSLASFTLSGVNAVAISGQALPADQRRCVFVYTGMGPQWWGMGRELMETEPAFRDALQRFDKCFRTLSGWSVIEALGTGGSDARMARTEVAQPANAALQLALTAALAERGIRPDAVVGHSVGEVAAAHACGALSLKDAVLVSYHRSRLQQTTAGQGGMLAVGLSEKEALGLLHDFPLVSIAAINSPAALTLAGPDRELSQIASLLETNDVFQRRLKVEVPYHSATLEQIREQLLRSLSALRPGDSRIPFYSTVTADRIDGQGLDAAYFWSNARETVRFFGAMQALVRDGHGVFVEIGPHPVLGSSLRECFKDLGTEASTVPTLIRGEPEHHNLLRCVGNLHALGFPVNWSALAPRKGTVVSLPHYPWQRERLWAETERSREARIGRDSHVYLSEDKRLSYPAWEVELNRYYFPFLDDHRLQETIVVPGAAYAEAGLALHRELFGGESCTLEDLAFHQMLIPESSRVQCLHFAYQPKSRVFSVQSRYLDDCPDWKLHATGVISPLVSTRLSASLDQRAVMSRCRNTVDVDAFYRRLSDCGLQYGPLFRCIQSLHVGEGEALVRVRAHESIAENQDRYLVHPTLLDACFQSFVSVASEQEKLAKPYVPVAIRRLHLFRPMPSELLCHVRVTALDVRRLRGELTVYDPEGRAVMAIEGLECQAITHGRAAPEKDNLLYNLSWEESRLPRVDPDSGNRKRCLIFTGSDRLSSLLFKRLKAEHLGCVKVTACQEGFSRVSEHEVRLRRGSTEDLARLFELEPDVSQIVYAWSLDASRELDRTLGSVLDYCTEMTDLANLARSSAGAIAITTLTRRAQAVLPTDKVQDVSTSVLDGLAQLIANEKEQVSCRVVDLGEDAEEDEVSWIAGEILSSSRDTDVAYRARVRYVRRLLRDTSSGSAAPQEEPCPTTEPVSLTQSTAGDVESLRWCRSTRRELAPNEIELKVCATALNFKDLLKVFNNIADSVIEGTFFGYSLGMECSGQVNRVGSKVTRFQVGDEVFSVIKSQGGFHSYICLPEDDGGTLKKPSWMKFEEAVIFVPFITAYYGLHHLARLSRGERVLIHNAAGGVGLSALQVSKWLGAEVFATAGSPERRAFLEGLGVDHVLDSRSLEFAERIREMTEGGGVDVVLSALPGDALVKSFELLAPYGRYIEIGKADISNNAGLPMRTFQRNTSFISLDADRILLERPGLLFKIWEKEIAPLFEARTFRQLPTTVFPAAQVKEAFRAMKEGKYPGKIVVSLEGQTVPVEPEPEQRTGLRRDGTVLVTGGTRGLGFEIARWLAAQGVRGLVLASRSGTLDPESQVHLDAMRAAGTKVRVEAVDITDEAAVRALLEKIGRELPPLSGIIHGAMVLDDGPLAEQTRERYRKVLEPKVLGAWWLHKHTAALPIDFFLCLSSVSSIIGNKGQASYVAANAFLDSFAHFRRGLGLPASTVNLGAVAEVGVVARSEKLEELFRMSGIECLPPRDVLIALETVLARRPAQAGLFRVDWDHWANVNKRDAASSRLKRLLKASGGGRTSAVQKSLRKLVPLSEVERCAAVEEAVRGILAKVLNCSVAQVGPSKSIKDLGVDSLMVVELQLQMENGFGVQLSNMDLLKGPSAAVLARTIVARLEPTLKLVEEELLEGADQMPEEEQDDLMDEAKGGSQGPRKAQPHVA